MRLNIAMPSPSQMRVRSHGWSVGLAATLLLIVGLSIALSTSAAELLAPTATTTPGIQNAATTSRSVAVSVSTPTVVETAVAAPVHVRTIEGIGEYRLPNGLQILLVPDASKPVVTVQLTVRAGALQDPAGASGVMHLLEHMMFRARPGQGSPFGEIARRGIRTNATTSHDRTTFMASFAADADVQRWYLAWLAGAFADSSIESEAAASEIGAIRNEMQGAQGSALGVAMEATLWTLYAGQGYGRPPIGRLAEIESLDVSRLTALRADRYRPDRTTLVVAGAFETEETLDTIVRAFGVLPQSAERTGSEDRFEPTTATSARSLVLMQPGVGPLVMAATPGPAARDGDAAAARLLVYALTREPSGLLNRRLVDAGIAARVMGQARTQANGGTLMFAAQPAAGQEPAAVAEALRKALADAVSLTPEQVDQARYGWMAEWRRRFNDPERLAEDLSESSGRGDWRLHLADYARIETLSREDLHRVASDWLNAPLLVSLLPDSATAKPATRGSISPTVLPESSARVAKATRRAATLAPSNEAASPTRPQTKTLAGGRLALSVVRRPQRGGAVLARLAFPMLASSSSQEQTRAAGLMAAMLGTYRATPGGSSGFQLELDRIETELTVGFFRQELLIDIQTRADRFDAAMGLVRTLLETSRFEEEALQGEKRKWRGRLDRASQDLPTRLSELLSRHDNPHAQNDVRYAPTIEEEIASLQRIGLGDIERARTALMPLREARVAVVGDIDTAMVASSLARHLKPLLAVDATQAPALVDDVRQAPAPKTLTWRGGGSDNAALTWVAFLPLREGDPDALALMLGNRIFGQQGSGRLWRRLREREGLSYGAWSELEFNAMAPSSWWRLSASFGARDARRVERTLAEELNSVERDGFSADELAQAKTGYLQEQRRLIAQPGWLLSRQLQALRTRANAIEAPLERRISELSLEDVNAAWRRHIHSDQLVRAMAGNVPEEMQPATAPMP